MQRVIDERTYPYTADFVHCNNCESAMLVDVGAEVCPICKTKGCLSWIDGEDCEVNDDYFDTNNKYILIP